MNTIIQYKTAKIERCINRAHKLYADSIQNLNDETIQDSIVLNIQRACEASIDLAIHLICEKNSKSPQSRNEVFQLLYEENLIDRDLYCSLVYILDFCKLAVHDYQDLEIKILGSILNKHISDFKKFTQIVLMGENV